VLRFFSYLLDFFYPRLCVHCSDTCTRHSVLCDRCAAQLYAEVQRYSDRNRTAPEKIGDIDLYCGFAYTGVAQTVHRGIKYGQLPFLAPDIGNMVASAYGDQFFRQFDCIIPIPAHPLRQILRARPHPVGQYLRGICSVAKSVPVVTGLRCSYLKKSQVSLSRAQRQKNIVGSFKPVRTLADKLTFHQEKQTNVLLLDDVATTGATLLEAVKTLKSCCSSISFSAMCICRD